jgi:AraC-like DNA-binding protein
MPKGAGEGGRSVERRLDPPRGLLDAAAARRNFRHARYLPSEDLASFVEHYWRVEWALPAGVRHRQESLPHPSVHVVAEATRCQIVGVVEGRFVRVLEAAGRAFGVKFRPGGFQPFCSGSVRAFTNRRVSVREVFGVEGHAYGQAVAAESIDERAVELAEALLRAARPRRDPEIARVGQIVQQIATDTEITHVDELARRAGSSTRSLQRLFGRYVGVSPKWVILRYRLHEALERIDSGQAVDWAQLAADLGYFDQAHFIRHFKSLVGRAPEAYARSLAFVAKNP